MAKMRKALIYDLTRMFLHTGLTGLDKHAGAYYA